MATYENTIWELSKLNSNNSKRKFPNLYYTKKLDTAWRKNIHL